MKQKVGLWQWFGFAVTVLLGTVLHFLYDWLGGARWVAPFSAVNESIWEHLKLLFYPMLAFALVEYGLWGKHVHRFWTVKLLGVLAGLAVIPALYYTYTGALGTSADWFNITIFFLAAGLVFWAEVKLFGAEKLRILPPWLAFGMICAMAVGFTLLTFFPPRIPLFQDPQTGGYG